PPPPRPYRDYIAWLAERDQAAAERYWRRTLAGFAVPTPAPFDHPAALGGADGSHAADYYERTAVLPVSRTAGLESLAQRLQVTLNTLVQGAWALLLSRYAQISDVVFGAVVSGRPAELPGVESMVGLFINSLPVRVEILQDEAASSWLARLQAGQFEQSQYAWTPLARIQAFSEVPAGEPLFTSLLAFQNYPLDPAVSERLSELRIGDVALNDRTNYPLTLSAVARGELALRLTADRRFEPATTRRMLAHLDNLLGALAADPERPLRSLPLLASAERHQLTVEWNDTATAFPEVSIPALFAEQVARRPEAPALRGPGREDRLSYGALDRRAGALARELARQGIGRGDLVGLFAERSAELVIAVLAILKTGAAYLPLDPSYPRERLALMLADGGAPLVLVQPELAARLPAGAARTMPLVPSAFDGAPWSGATATTTATAADLAYVVYTSGSTGVPKGVAVTHRSVVRLVRDTDYADFGPNQIFLMMAPVSFDASTFELWGPLLNGGCLAILPPGEVTLDGLERAIHDAGVTTLWLTAGLFHLVVDERLAAVAPLRQLLAGGDVLSPPHVARLRRELPGLRLVNGYGPTENTTFTTYHRVERVEGANVPIGRPIANTRVLVLGRDLEPAPIGVPGELYAGGAGLAVGYLGRSALTAAAFVPALFSERPGERLYRTGDLARRLPDGSLDFLGRADRQVKVRGFRIELGEIEATLADHPAVREAAVVALRDDGRERRLVAWTVPRGAVESAPPAEAVLADLAARLPAYMVPVDLIWLDALPLSPTGKVDRAALAAMATAVERGEAVDLTPPRGAVEETLAAIWRQVLGCEQVGVHDNFFRLGGDSILSIQIVARARQAGLVVTPRQIFEEQTIAALAAVSTPLAAAEVEQGAVGGEVPLTGFPLAGLDQRDLDALVGTGASLDLTIEDLYPLAPLQQGMLFEGIFAPDSELYFQQLIAELAGPLDTGAFIRAWQAVVDRHPALRTAFAWEGLKWPLQVVRQGVRLPWTEEDWRQVPRQEVPQRLAAWLAADRARSFDLARPPLMRAALLRTGEDRYRFVWSFHHLLIDGWCLSLIFREVFALYQAGVAGRDAHLPAVHPYREFIAWVARRDAAATDDFFRRELAGFTAATRLPLDRPALPAGDDGAPPDQVLRLPPALVAELTELAQSRELTLNTLAQGAWALLLARYGGTPDVVFGTVVSGRPAELPGVESMIGLFINTLPVRLAADPAAPLDVWLAGVQERLLELRQHETAALAQVQRASEVPPGEPLFQSIVAFENFPVDESLGEGAEEIAVSEVTVTGRTDYPLSFAVLPGRRGSNELSLSLSHDRRTDTTTARRLLLHLERLLGAFVAAPQCSLGELPTLSAAERHQLVLEWNDTVLDAAETAEDLCLHDLMSVQARLLPTAVALSGEGREMTYAELDRRTNQLANHLGALGVGPESRVAIMVERSLEMVVAVLGILKAGGAYVPIDPATPADRLDFLLADARPALLLAGEGLADRLREAAVAVVALDAERERIAAASVEPPAVMVDPENLAYIIYTSGSTGTPKGVAVRHRSAVAYARAVAREYGMRAGDRELQFASLSFDASVEEIFAPLAAGATVVPRSGPAEEPARFLAGCAELGITVLSLPTAYWHQIAAAAETGDPPLPPALRLIVMGGERALPERWTAWGRGPGNRVRLVNAYGPTEATIAATLHEHPGTPDPLAGRREVPIGRPLAGVRAQVVDRDLWPVPAGGIGELVLGGVGVARGYLGRPGLTAERFVPDPFSGEPGARLYRTGDLVQLLPGGTLEFAGRLDDQVKVRGFRIEPGEIEAVLATHPGLREAAVVVHRGDSLLACVVPTDAAEPPAIAELRAFLAERLPAHMVPTAYAVLPALPLTSGGKVDRRALARQERVTEPTGERVAPATPLEELLARAAAEVLGVGVERVGMRDNFFDLGGHSLLATQLVSQLSQGHGIQVTLQMVFDASDLGELADRIVEAELARVDSGLLDEALREMEGMTPEELQDLLGGAGGLGLEEDA
ncbi:MAG TPA: amino acid adenylation domain-containing protein, partial [Thermoanaerobaculia bacterium]|nr:amino acid adenylation domain-containing protein [Thermoanaerobaculia bacterium]